MDLKSVFPQGKDTINPTHDIKLFSGRANPKLAEEIAEYLGTTVGPMVIKNFADGETYVQVQESIRGDDVFIIQPVCSPVNQNAMELLIMIDAFKRASAKSVTAVIPYYGYARQDRKTTGREAITAKLMADLLTTAGANRVLALDLQQSLISRYEQYEIALTETEETKGHHIFRLDAPVLNKAGDKLIIGTWMRKTNPATGANESNFTRLGSKSVVVDYPSLKNPTVITSTVGDGDTSGYRSFNAFVANDGNIYQATQRGSKGSYILKINQTNQYDNSYVFSLDNALSVTGTYVDAWRYAGNGIAYVMYTHAGVENQGFIARVDLNAKTATVVDLPYQTGLDFGQYQGFVVDGDEVYVAVTPVGKDGNIYILNSKTGNVTKGAKLVNGAGNHYIGVY